MKFIVIGIVLFVLASCKGGAGKSDNRDTALDDIINTGATALDTTTGVSGSSLIAKNDCLTCHKIQEKSFGPSYIMIAEKYGFNQGNVENLADRIIKGASGLWGSNKMTPHPNLTQAEAQSMARYILSLKDSTGNSK